DDTANSLHYEIHALARDEHFRVVLSLTERNRGQLRVALRANFDHAIVDRIGAFDDGWHDITDHNLALDYVRGNLFKSEDIRFYRPADLKTPLTELMTRAAMDPAARLFAFGSGFGPENRADRYFGFTPGRGVHDLHLNQGNPAQFYRDDGIYQDGGIVV